MNNHELLMQASQAGDRTMLWSEVLLARKASTVAEIGVYRGEFAEILLKACPDISKYYLLDPWRHLSDWNKPANRDDVEFQQIKAEALRRTEFAAEKRIILQGKTTEVSSQIPDGSLDFAYIDGDHTLRGITLDLLHVWPKMKPGSILGGDDFTSSIWQHPTNFEPTMVFPMAVYFAEAMGATIYGLPFNQFAIIVNTPESQNFEFHDLTGEYQSRSVRDALASPPGRGFWHRCQKKLKGLLKPS